MSLKYTFLYSILLVLFSTIGVYAQTYPGGVNTGTVKGWRAEAYWDHPINNNPNTFGQGTSNPIGKVWAYVDYIDGNEFITLRGDNFSIEYTAKLNITTAGSYQFRLSGVDDYAWLYIDGNLVASASWFTNNAPGNSGYVTYNLTAGEHDIKVKMSEGGGAQGVAIDWQGGSIPANSRLDARYVYVPNAPMSHWLNLEGAEGTQVGSEFRVSRITNKAPNGANQKMFYESTGTGGYTFLQNADYTNFNPTIFHDGDDYFTIRNNTGVGNGFTNGLSFRGAPMTHFYAGSQIADLTGQRYDIGYGSGCENNRLRGLHKWPAGVGLTYFGGTNQNPITFKTNEHYVSSGYSEYTTAGQTNFVTFLNSATSGVTLNNVPTANLTTSIFGLHTATCNVGANRSRFNEYLYYPFELDATQRRKVNTYLAIKWGTNFQNNWLSPDGTIVWNKEGTVNTGYQNRVFGIARDASNGNLNQKQSQSQVRTAESNFQNKFLTISKGAIAATNAANTGVIPDGSYLIVGDNDGALANQTTEIPSSFTGCTYGRIGREWKAQVTGNPGPITVRAGSTDAGSFTFPKSATGHQLVVDEDKDGNFTTGTIRTYNYTALANGIATFDNVTINDGEVFTFVYKLVSPGGVANGLSYWVKADDGTPAGNMSVWNDLSTSGINMTAFSDPSLEPNQINYNPAVFFDGNDFFGLISNFTAAYTAGEVFALGKSIGTTVQRGGLYTFGGLGGHHYTWSDGAIYDGFGTNDRLGYNPSTGVIVDGKTGISSPLPFTFNVQEYNMYNIFSATNNWGKNINGRPLASTTTNTVSFAKSDAYVLIGATPNYVYYGHIPEVALYNRVLTAAERNQVESYLALKYSQPLGNGLGTSVSDYVSSNGTTIWTGNATYRWNMFGIGRDDCSGLDQRQSKSGFFDTKSNVRFGLGTINETQGNAGNTTIFSSDNSFMVMASNVETTDFTSPLTTGLPTAYSSTSCNPRMWKASWRVKRTNMNQDIELKIGNKDVPNLKIAKSMTNPVLVVDPTGSGDFTSGTLIQYTTLKSGEATFKLTPAQLPDGAVFTLVWTQATPGGVGGTMPYVWYDANDIPFDGSVTPTTDWTWADISTNGRNATMSITGGDANRPSFEATRQNTRNYNPIVKFDGVNDFMQMAGPFDNFTAGFHHFSVMKFKSTASWARVFCIGNGANNNNIFLARNSTTTDLSGQVVLGSTQQPYATATNAIVNNITNLFELSINAGAAGTTQTTNLFADSKPLALTNNMQIPNIVTRNNRWIARSNWPADALNNSDYNEIIFYNSKLSAAERLRVQSYLGVQWGFTLDQTTAQNYLASDGTTTWSFASANQGANGNFNRDITAIGRDDCFSLNQKQSNSIDGDDIMRFGLDSLRETNEDNLSKFSADRSYLFLAHNGQNYAGNQTNMPPGLTSTQCYYKMNRIWQVQKIGTGVSNPLQFIVGKSGQVTFNSIQVPKLLISNSPTDFSGATIVSATKVRGGLAYFDNVTLNHLQYITIAFVEAAPGGVSAGLVRWYDASKGAYTDNEGFYPAEDNNELVQTWDDLSSFNADVTQGTVANRPKFKKAFANFNPTLEFDGVNDNLINDIYTGLPSGGATRTVGAVASTSYSSAPSSNWPAVIAYGGTAGGGSLFAITQRETSIDATLDRGSGTVNLTNGFAPVNSNKLIYGKVYSPTSSGINSNLGPESTGTLSFNSVLNNFGIGYQRYANNYYWKGTISEIYIYNRVLTTNEDLRIGSVMSIKYGSTLNILNNPAFPTKNYLDGNSTPIYTYTNFWNRITGIGRDFCGNLDQKQSLNTEAGALVAISTDTTNGIYESNLDNPISLTTDASGSSYQIFGDDNLPLAWTGERTVKDGDKVLSTLVRTFRVSEKGTVNSVFLQVSDAGGTTYNSNQAFLPSHVGGDVYLVVANTSTGGNFMATTGVTVKKMDYVGATKTWQTTYNFANGDYYTFATEIECLGPAGILGNLQLWLRANDGTGQTTQGAAVATWTDASPSGNNATGVSSPAFQNTGAGLINYNPSVLFNGTSSYFNLPNGFSDFTAGASSFVVRKKTGTNDAWGRFFHLSTGGNNNLLSFNRSNTTENIGIAVHNASGTNLFLPGTTSTPLVSNNPNVLGFTLQGGSPLQTGRNFKFFNDGAIEGEVNTGVVPTNINRTANMVGNSPANEFMNGFIPEIILYNAQLTNLQAQKVNTYLAIKYGVTMTQNYVSPSFDGTNGATETLYNVSSFGNRITGVGIDKMGCLVQNQSKNQDGGLVAISVDGTINAINSANKTKWNDGKADRNYIVMGDDNKSITSFVRAGTTGNEPVPAIYDGCIVNRINRNWKVQVKGENAPNLLISIPANSSTETVKLPALPANFGTLNSFEQNKLYLVINENPDFTVNANMQEVELVLNTTTNTYEATIAVNPDQKPNHTFYYTIVNRLKPCREGCLKSNKNVRSYYIK